MFKKRNERSTTPGYALLTSQDENLINKRKENLEIFSKAANKNLTSGNTDSRVLPNQIHYIWVGDDLPPKYRLMMLQGKKLNPHYNYNLWYCKEILTKEQAESLESFAKTNRIKLHNVTEYEFENAKYIQDGINNKEWAKASDLLRAERYFAGIYLDTDNRIVNKLPDAKEIDLNPYGINIGLEYEFTTTDSWGNSLTRQQYTPSVIARPYEVEGEESTMSIYRKKMKEKLDAYEKETGRTSGFTGTYENGRKLIKTTGCIMEALGEVIPGIKVYDREKGRLNYRIILDLVKLPYRGHVIKEPFTDYTKAVGKGYISCSNPDNTYFDWKNKSNTVEKGWDLAAAVIQSNWKQSRRRDTTSYKYAVNRAKLNMRPITQNEQKIEKAQNIVSQLDSRDSNSTNYEKRGPKLPEKYLYKFPERNKFTKNLKKMFGL